MGEGRGYLAEAYDHVLEVAKHDTTYRRQKHNAEDNHEREYKRDLGQCLAVFVP